jgi:starch synthase
VVATRSGGTPEIVADGVEGLLVPPRDPAALAAAVGRLLDDPALRAALGAAGAARAARDFGVAAHVERIARVYDGARGRAGAP